MKNLYVITEYEDIIDVCTTEENAKKAREYWIENRLQGNSHCDDYNEEEEVRESIQYEQYTPDQYLK